MKSQIVNSTLQLNSNQGIIGFFLVLSETSFTDLQDGEYSLDEDDGDTTAALLNNARQSVNLPPQTAKRAAPATASSATERAKKRKENSGQARSGSCQQSTLSVHEPAPTARKSVNFLNSDKWGQEMRPPHLRDDDVFNAISVEAASQQIMNWMTTQAMMASNNIKESKAKHRAGKEKPDEEIKKVMIVAGEDDAMGTLHKQRFNFRTPLSNPKDYWALMPVRWPEVNKSIYLENIGLDNICSPRTLELLHDRSSPLEIKMFLTLNISVGRAGVAKKQNLRTLEDGSTEVVSSDDWLSPTSINQLLEALDNLVAVWVVMWPGEWSMVAMRRAVTKHLAFGDIQNADLRKKMLEAFINEILSSNASLAARGKPPMEFEKLDKLAIRYLDNKRHYEKSFKVETTDNRSARNDIKKVDINKGFNSRKEVNFLKSRVGTLKTASGKNVCLFWNSKQGCRDRRCELDHVCAYVNDRENKLCGKGHKKMDHGK